MFGRYPASTPASFQEDSVLLQAARAGRDSLEPHAGQEERGHLRNRSLSIGSSQISIDMVSDEEPESESEEEQYVRPVTPVVIGHSALNNATEQTPLLPIDNTHRPSRKTGFQHEITTLVKYMVPIAGTHFLEYSLLVVTVISVGHIGTIELAAASLASMTSNVVALSVIQGFCCALDTLCPQAWTSKPKDTSLHALRTFVLLIFLLIPQFIIFWNSEALLLLIKQDPRVAERASVYLKALSFGLPFYSGFECIRRYLQAQGLMVAPVLALAVAAPLNVVLNYLLVWGPEPIRLGFVGAPIATALSMFAMCMSALYYTVVCTPRDAWGGLTWDIFNGLWPNIQLGLAGTAMVGSEWWSWEIVGIASSFLGPTALGAQSILLTTSSLFYQVPYSLSVAGSVRVGNLLGLQRPRQARISSRAAMLIAVITASINSLILVVFRKTWGSLFSDEKAVIDFVATVLPLVALFQLTDGLSGATSGLMRGAGKATLGATINLASYYVIGLPIGIWCCFGAPKFGLEGLWLGLTIALTLTAILNCGFIWNLDWKAESDRTAERMGVDKIHQTEEV